MSRNFELVKYRNSVPSIYVESGIKSAGGGTPEWSTYSGIVLCGVMHLVTPKAESEGL